MVDPVRKLYESRDYPAMSHPLTDPAVTSVSAMLGGLDVPDPAAADMLEIGCGSGHNLIPLAMRWPNARFTGIDMSERAIRLARELASKAGVGNIEFHAADLRSFRHHRGEFDFIIAHGFFSWVTDDVKRELLEFCAGHLTRPGIATISFNLECGWRRRMPVIRKTRAILEAGAPDLTSALGLLRNATDPDSGEIEVIDDMLAKGEEILPFDDFAPVNDPWPLARFVASAVSVGLHWMGESDPGNNLPRGLSDEVVQSLREAAGDPIAYQAALDEAAGRTFRSGILCRKDAPRSGGFALGRVFQLAGRSGRSGPIPSHPTDYLIQRTLSVLQPTGMVLGELKNLLPQVDRRELARRIHEGILQGWILPRISPAHFAPDPPQRPWLDLFRLECARRRLPLVDVWHRPCKFPKSHYPILQEMDGRHDLAGLEKVATRMVPKLNFRAWISHLAARGLFA